MSDYLKSEWKMGKQEPCPDCEEVYSAMIPETEFSLTGKLSEAASEYFSTYAESSQSGTLTIDDLLKAMELAKAHTAYRNYMAVMSMDTALEHMPDVVQAAIENMIQSGLLQPGQEPSDLEVYIEGLQIRILNNGLMDDVDKVLWLEKPDPYSLRCIPTPYVPMTFSFVRGDTFGLGSSWVDTDP